MAIMEHFFNHEEERLEFTAARMQRRMVEKKALDIQKVEASTKVCIFYGILLFILRMTVDKAEQFFESKVMKVGN